MISTNELAPPRKKPLQIGTGEPTGDKTTDAGHAAFNKTLAYIEAKGGRFALDDTGEPQLILEGKQIPLTPKNENTDLNTVLTNATNYTMTVPIGRTAATLLQIYGKQAGGKIRTLPFSYFSREESALYIPHAGNQILRVTAHKTKLSPNGATDLWLNPPKEGTFGPENPLNFCDKSPLAGLAQFERLCVDSIPVEAPAMRWFLAMQEGLFPYIRHLTTELMIVVHKGEAGSAKTFAAARFYKLHGLGNRVDGDNSPAWFRNGGCNKGFFTFDNKESINLTPGLIDLLLQISTGATSGRSSSDGKQLQSGMKDRPVSVVTTIEGLNVKEELVQRTITVPFLKLPDELKARYDGDGAMDEISEQRHLILSAFIKVIQQFLADGSRNAALGESSDSIPKQALRFKGNYVTLMQLLHAYGKVAERPPEWAEEIIAKWHAALNDVEYFEGPLEMALESAITRGLPEHKKEITWDGKKGVLYVFIPNRLFSCVLNSSIPIEIRSQLPKVLEPFMSRVRALSGPRFYALTEKKAPEHHELRRAKGKRVVGIFIAGEEIDAISISKNRIPSETDHLETERQMIQ